MQVSQPALMITAELDIVLRPEMANGMQTWVPKLRNTVLIEGSGHWNAAGEAREVNHAMQEFLADLRK
jgi:soluble epoxide hydrolase/lipid-phosphate phosphatase